MKKKRFLVIGLGILGESVAKTLSQEGAEVIAVDSNLNFVNAIKDHVSVAIHGDTTDPKLFDQLGARNVDAAIVCIGENFAGAILTTAHLLDIKVKHVAVRATNALNASIFKRLGAHDVFFVESEMGKILAHKLQNPDMLNEMPLGADFSIVEWAVPDWMQGRSLQDLALPVKYSVHVIALRDKNRPHEMILPHKESVLSSQHHVLLSGKNVDLSRLMNVKT